MEDIPTRTITKSLMGHEHRLNYLGLINEPSLNNVKKNFLGCNLNGLECQCVIGPRVKMKI